jgi:alkylated DNA repair dioxygenase AlkB
MAAQSELFSTPPPVEGFRYEREFLSPDEEQSLLRLIRQLPFQEFKFHAFTGKRRTVSFGWKYDYDHERALPADPIPAFLLDLRIKAAGFGRVSAESLLQISIIEYGVGAGIGWHRDKRAFGDVIGISLLSACRFRLRRPRMDGWERVTVITEPRSIYLLSGPSRHVWEHSIPPVEAMRYSITLRAVGPGTKRTAMSPAAV